MCEIYVVFLIYALEYVLQKSYKHATGKQPL